ncbi:DUF4244 domain-containing protein [Streptomyces olivoreticuli]|uniref:DUF4244 domain-containing protein n=1 Tax=Streptomyces olivoreticuli TaxID=68246 RepID=UPI001F085310|nr:DUF4244 domain-containing protein [Streptomyces olivoreticuli]
MRETKAGEVVMAMSVMSWWSNFRSWQEMRVGARSGAGAEAGMSTAEYAIGTLAACALAAVLYKVVTSGAVTAALQGLIEKALHAPF